MIAAEIDSIHEIVGSRIPGRHGACHQVDRSDSAAYLRANAAKPPTNHGLLAAERHAGHDVIHRDVERRRRTGDAVHRSEVLARVQVETVESPRNDQLTSMNSESVDAPVKDR